VFGSSGPRAGQAPKLDSLRPVIDGWLRRI
jgi:hypothetical protein